MREWWLWLAFWRPKSYLCDMGRLFSGREIRALAMLLPLLVVAVWVLVSSFGGSEPSAAVVAEVKADTTATDTLRLRPFDPNTVTYEELREMNIKPFVARGIVKYRASGRTYSIVEDVAVVYGVSDSLYALLKPHIRIAEEFQLKPHEQHYRTSVEARRREFNRTPFDPNTLSAEGFRELGCFTARQAEAIVEYRQRVGGFRSPDDFADCYIITDSLYALLKPYITLSPLPEVVPAKVDINTADSAELVAVRGIGPRTAGDMIRYRQRLGGYHSIEQLKDLAVVTERNYELFEEKIWCDSCKIQKIDINFASPKVLGAHPYMTPARVRKIMKIRQLKGGWSTTQEMIDDNIFTTKEAEMIGPYLQFVQKTNP